MNLLERKMHLLRDYNHDFPRLAKQSGFYFQLHRGKVNWSEIECLNLDDITENRNFELLEENLLNIINCNLERDYNLKILDQNFVKLFKLAQLGIDYLSYCELYLDRCVVLLQEQLNSMQEEFESLKNENEEKNAEIKKIKSKKKTNNYQCGKCDKVFISDVYLKFHDKRRHSTVSTPKSEKGFSKNLVDAFQQTENERKLSVSVQTVLEETETTTQNSEEIRKINKAHNKKIKRLEKNLKDLKARLQKTEKALQETREGDSNSGHFSFPASAHYHSHLQFMPPLFPPSVNIHEAMSEYQKSFSKCRSPSFDFAVDSERQKSPTFGNVLPKEYDVCDDAKNSATTKIDLINDKENMDPRDTITATKPLPPPRKTKKKYQSILHPEENLTLETFNQLSSNSVTDVVPVSNQSIDFSSVKGKSEPDIHSENFHEIKESLFEDVNEKKTDSNESLNISKEKSGELKSFFKRVVGSSPKIQKLRKNIRRPLTNLYDSVSSTGKDFMRIESKFQNTKSVLVDGLNNQLRELGIDPEWKGIPKGTMKQKLKDLTIRRKLLSKENPLYQSVRQSTEEKIFERLKNFPRKTLKKFNRETEEEFHSTDGNPCHKSQESENSGTGNCAILYDTDTDSCARTPELEKKNRRKQAPLLCGVLEERLSDSDSKEEDDARKRGEKKFDISMFQIKRGNMDKKEETRDSNRPLNEADEQLTTSDSEDDFDDEFFKTGRIRDKNDGENDGMLK